MENKKSLEKTVQYKSINKEIVKSLLIPGYSFKIWNNDRKNDGTNLGDFLYTVEAEMIKSLAYVIAGSAIYDAVTKYM